MDIAEVNTLGFENFIIRFENVLERSPLASAVVWSRRPFRNVQHLHECFNNFIDSIPPECVLQVLPDLAGRLSEQVELSAQSLSEQQSAGLIDMRSDDRGRLTQLNSRFENVLERSPLAAAVVWSRRPFRDVQHLHECFKNFIDSIPPECILQVFPDLAGRLSEQGELSAESLSEHQSAGLIDMSSNDRGRLTQLNSRYKLKFDFPFVICARLNNLERIFSALISRLQNHAHEERIVGLLEVKKIVALRLNDLLPQINSNI